MTDTPEVDFTIDTERVTEQVLRGLITSLRDRRQLFEHREEIDELLSIHQQRDGIAADAAIHDALALAIHANNRHHS